MFDENQTACPQCNHFIMSGDGMTVTVMIPVNYNNFANNSGLISVNKTMENCQLDWGLMHELAHCYSFTNKDHRFANDFNYTLDDSHTNPRGAVALQNCQGLENVDIVLDGHLLGNYKSALTNSTKYASGPVFDVIRFFGEYGNNISDGWIKLEKYFSGDYNYYNAYSGKVDNPNLINGVVYGAQEVINESSRRYYYNDVKFSSADTYRFINTLYFLSKQASSNGYGSTKDQFKSFLRNFVGADVFAEYVKCTNTSELGEAIISNKKGDLNLDGKIDKNDLTAADKYFADNYSLNDNGLRPEGAYNFDMNNDGYINQTDKSLLQKKIK